MKINKQSIASKNPFLTHNANISAQPDFCFKWNKNYYFNKRRATKETRWPMFKELFIAEKIRTLFWYTIDYFFNILFQNVNILLLID